MTKSEYKHSGFFVIRTPLLPFNEFQTISEPRFGTTDRPESSQEYISKCKYSRDRLQQISRRPEVQEALWIGSPDLTESLAYWWNEPETPKGRRAERAFYRYFARITSRATPFGLFAGCSVGRIGGSTRLEIGPRESYKRFSRIDIEYLFNLALSLSSDSSTSAKVLFKPNSSLYAAANRIHYVQSRQDSERRPRFYYLMSVEATPALELTLKRALQGATRHSLSSALVEADPEISVADAEDYIGQLIRSQVLVPTLTPAVIGAEPIREMIDQVILIPEFTRVADILSDLAKKLQRADANGLANSVSVYQEIEQSARQLPVSFQREHLVQVDMTKPSPNATLGEDMVREILRGVEILRCVSPAFQDDILTSFVRDFEDRYQNREVPLVEALDEEIGIGFDRAETEGAEAEPLLDELRPFQNGPSPTVSWGSREDFLLGRIEEVRRNKKLALSLSPADIDALRVPHPLPLPKAFAAIVAVGGIGVSPTDDCSLALESVFGPSGANLLARFCHTDTLLHGFIREHIRAEQESEGGNVIFAEIAHLPQGRLGNILCRPTLRPYEIVFLGKGSVSAEFQIPITDLLVSVSGRKIILRSRRLGREILPRLTTTHNYGSGANLKLYKFLCSLQRQGTATPLTWNWGVLDRLSFLPRVQVDGIVLSRARWRLTAYEVEALVKERGLARWQAVQRWREAVAGPRFISLMDADNELLIDLDNPLAVDTLLELVKGRAEVRLLEMFPQPADLCAEGPEGRFVHQLVVPFVRQTFERRPSPDPEITANRKNIQTSMDQPSVPGPDRNAGVLTATQTGPSFLPSSEWLFAKLYGSPYYVDRLLVEIIEPFKARVLSSGLADGWFFIRYGDPHWHLRLRFHGDPQILAREVLPALSDCLTTEKRAGRLWRLAFDTYEREVDRYGGEHGILLSERLFQHDSEMILGVLGQLSGDAGMRLRWQFSTCTIDRLLSAFQFKLEDKLSFAESFRDALTQQFARSQAFRTQLSDIFRTERTQLERMLDSLEKLPEFASVSALVSIWQHQLTKVGRELLAAEAAGKLTKTVRELCASYIHMHINRFLRSSQPAQEPILYNFLSRCYESRLSRQKELERLAAN